MEWNNLRNQRLLSWNSIPNDFKKRGNMNSFNTNLKNNLKTINNVKFYKETVTIKQKLEALVIIKLSYDLLVYLPNIFISRFYVILKYCVLGFM